VTRILLEQIESDTEWVDWAVAGRLWNPAAWFRWLRGRWRFR